MELESPGIHKQFFPVDERYDQLLESLPAAVYTCDAQGYILKYNQAALRLWGREPKIGIDQWCGSWKIFNPDGTPLAIDKCPMAIVIKEGRVVNDQEIIIETPTGQRFNVIPHPSPILDDSGKVIGAINMLVDVTAHRQTEQRLRESETRLRLATEGTQLATWDLNLQTREIIYSPRLARIFGHPETQKLTHREMRNQIHPDDIHSIVEKAFEIALNTGEYNYEARIIHADKSIHWIKTLGKVIYDENKIPLRILGTIMDITERREITEKSESLAAIVQSSDDAIISKNLDGIITSWNAAAQRIFGYTSVEMIGQPMLRLIPSDRVNEETVILTKLKKGERIDHFETLRVTKGGKVLNVSLTISPIKDGNGVIIGASKIARDITAQKQAEKTIAENEERLQIVVNASELGMWELNLKTNAISFSDRSKEILGYPSDTVFQHEEVIKHIHPDDRAIREKGFKDALEKGQLMYVVRLVWPNDVIRWVETRGKVFYDDRGQPESLIGTIRDITEDRASQQELFESEQKFRLLADSMPQFVWTGDATGNLNYFNQSLFDYSGLTFDQINNGRWIDIVHPDDRKENIEKWMHSIKTGESFLFEHRFRRHDGAYRWQMSRAEPQKDKEGKIQMWVGNSMDIHDRKLFIDELETKVLLRTKELHQLNEDLVKSNIELGQFAYVASHDLQEPLRKILTFATRILELDGDKFSEKSQDYFRRVQSASTRMKQLIVDLLSYSRANTAERKFETMDLTLILNTVIEQLKETIDQKQAVVNISPLPTLSIIPYQFEQLLTNILTNALKFSKPDTPPVITISANIVPGQEVRHGADLTKCYHRIAIRDNGIGFEPQFSERIFQVFQRLHGKDEYAGTGIGLSIVKKIVENHSGFVTTKSELGQGATFTIYIPVG